MAEGADNWAAGAGQGRGAAKDQGATIVLSALIILFREVLEAALVIGVVAAAVEGLPGRGRLVAAGVGLGALGAALVASAIGTISEFAHGTGQELFGAGVLVAAAGLMLAWHSIWMAEHGREMTVRLKRRWGRPWWPAEPPWRC